MVTFEKKERLINIIKGISIITLYFLITEYRTVPLAIAHIDYNGTSLLFRELYTTMIECIIIFIILIMFKNQIINAIKDIKKNHLTYFKNNLKYYLLGFFIMAASNAIIMVLGGSSSNNEIAVRNQLEFAPIYSFIAAVFLAPIIEEGVFRLGLRNIFKNNFLFILASGLIFGGLHLSGMLGNPLLGLYLLSYSCFGITFAYMLVKTNNIFVSMGFHFMHNGLLISLQLFVALFG